MNELTTKQIEFLNELLKGRPVAAIVEDLEIHYKELRQWKADPLFAEELTAVNEYMQFLREMDTRIGATEALRRGRITVEGGNTQHWLSDRQRRVGKDLVRLARQLDPQFPVQPHYRPQHTRNARGLAIARRALGEAREVVKRMEDLRERILEQRRLERAAREMEALPAPAGAEEGSAGE